MRVDGKIAASARWVFRAAIAGIFAYFGVYAIIDSEAQAAVWVRPDLIPLITNVLPIMVFMKLLGAAQVVTALLLVTGKFLKIGLVMAAALLVGIIFNLGFNDISMRDLVILTGVLYLLAQELRLR